MDDRYSPQPSTSEVKEVIVDSDEVDDFEDDDDLEVIVTPSPRFASCASFCSFNKSVLQIQHVK